jgi:hypothetical protein
MRTTTWRDPAVTPLSVAVGAIGLTVRRFVDLGRTASMMCRHAR